MQSRSDPPTGNVPWRDEAPAGGWRRKGPKAKCVNQGELPVQEPVGWSPGNYPCTTASEQAVVRAPIVATKGRNGSGAKGAQEGGDVTEQTQPILDAVPAGAKPAGEIRARWAWVEAAVWTERMLTALEQGVLGGQWYSWMDKVYALPNLRPALARVKANEGSGRRRPRDGEGVRATPGRELGKAFAFADLDRWVRKRLRSFLRKRQGRPGCARGWDNVQWPPAFFVRLELLSFVAAHASARQSSRR